MKKIFKYLPLLAVIALASCAKEAPSKSSVEAGFDEFTGTLPTVTISSKAECDAIEGYATVKVTYSGITDGLDSLSVGVLSDSDPTFRTANFTKVENPKDGTVSLKAVVTPNKTYYIRGVVACTAGTSYSDVIEVKVPDVPFYVKAIGAYSGEVTSAADGSKYTNTITVVAVSSDPQNKCYIFGIEPYYTSQGYGTDVTKALNVCAATIDNENKCLRIANATSINLRGSDGSSRYIYGFKDVDPTTSEYGEDVVLKLVGEDTFQISHAFGTVKMNADGTGGFEDYYNGGVSYKKK